MNTFAKISTIYCLFAMAMASNAVVGAEQRDIPDALKPWKDWVMWSDLHRSCPTTYDSADNHICFWPSRLSLSANQQDGAFSASVAVFAPTWIPLPGSAESWPFNVRVGGDLKIAVVERDGSPMVQLPIGRHLLSGEFKWDEMPQNIAIPQQIGLLSLSIEGQVVPIPNWDERSHVWLKRHRTEEAEKDLLSAQVYRVIEDGIPVWLHTDIELTVSGKSREEELGWILPEHWKLATVDSPIPVAVNERGRMKTQLRAGKWTISVHAYRSDDPKEIRFAEDSQPITNLELVGFQAKAEFRLAELEGIQAVDVSQTTFPEKWRGLPVYQWETGSAFRLIEKLRGMGLQRLEGLSINRHFWLDEDGQSLTYRDRVSGRMQRIWRLDVAKGQDLGTVRINGERQLITTNPQTDSHGVEVRQRSLNLEAIGRVDYAGGLSATGWQTDADSLSVTFSLPPGWRAFAFFGADRVEGDWLTAWSLLDLFILLILSLAVFRIWGFWAGLMAFLAFGLAYHEPGSPRLTWIFLLIPVALLKVVPEGPGRRWILRWKYVAVAVLLINLVPFMATQIQSTLYPQLERRGINYAPRAMFSRWGRVYERTARVADMAYESGELAAQQSLDTGRRAVRKSRIDRANLSQDPQALIQTGPAEPAWTWNQVSCAWDGPVSAEERITPILISLPLHRFLTIVRLGFLLMLAATLIGVRTVSLQFSASSVGAAVVMCLLLMPEQSAAAQIPDQNMLDTLRARLLEPADAYPHAGEIASVELQVKGNKVTMDTEVHTALQVAIPLPGRLPVWSPVSVIVDDKPADLVCRREGYLWVVLPKGVHRVVVESMLPDATEWEWTYLLRPHRVAIDAPDWNVSGVRVNGIPEQQVFFARQQQTSVGEAAYDRKEFWVVVAVDRHLETGLIWQVHNEVTRISSSDRAVSLKLPLLPGESVLSSNVVVQGGLVEVRLGAGQEKFSWNSELPIGAEIQLTAQQTDQWVERWHLLTSPVWNMTQSGLAPILEPQGQNLIPVWHPWPGEQVTLSFHKPLAVSGDTITVQRVHQDTSLGTRQRTTQLKLDVESSLGGDFVMGLDDEADISSLKLDGRMIPVRREEASLVVPVHPGRQSVEVNWRTDAVMEAVVGTDSVHLPVEGSNITVVMRIPDSRWVLWAGGPLRGPAVRFWSILVVAILAALLLGTVSLSPLRRLEWVLLALGLTQVHFTAAMVVVAWLFLLAWRGKQEPLQTRYWIFDLRQLGLVFITLVALSVLIVAVSAGLLGNPEMFIVGNNSSRTVLQWFQPRAGKQLPEPHVISISVWFYRLLMLLWALWLAAALLRWLRWGWNQFSKGGCWKRKPIVETA